MNSQSKHPIIAHGELYAEPIIKTNGFGVKSYPLIYEEAKARILHSIDNLLDGLSKTDEFFLEEKIICYRMEPKFEAKSYTPSSVLKLNPSDEIVGGRKYKYINDDGQEELAKLYFVKTTEENLLNLRKTLVAGHKDKVESWRKEIRSLRSLDLLSPEEKILGFGSEWRDGSVEIILHPMQKMTNEAIGVFNKFSKIPAQNMLVRSYQNGPTFISAKCSYINLKEISNLNPVRAVHPLGNVVIPEIRALTTKAAPLPPKDKSKSKLLVGVFDGGVAEEVPLLKQYVTSIEATTAEPFEAGIAHGTAVCGTVLYGDLADKTSNDQLETPCVSIESYRVLPIKDVNDFELYEAIDAIEAIVTDRKDIKLFNLSFGPNGAIDDDSISRFTYVLDKLTFEVEEDDINPLFTVAVGNDGDLPHPCNRIQAPADMINGLSVGAYTYARNGEKIRADYSCVGAGREGGKVKPDLLEFGGSLDHPFILTSAIPNRVVGAAGTSFASPLALHKISELIAKSPDITPHIGRVLAIHSTENKEDLDRNEQGFGFLVNRAQDMLECDDRSVTILYSGVIESTQTVKLPFFAPNLNGVKGTVNLKWTVATVVAPNIVDTDAYSCNCLLDTFYPHETKHNFTKPKCKSFTLDLLDEEDAIIARNLLATGYKLSDLPVSHPSKTSWGEDDLRSVDMKWDTVIKKSVTMRGSSLLNPTLTLQAIGRYGHENQKTRYFVALTVDAKNYQGSLYDSILQNYSHLSPIHIRSMNRILVDVE